MANDLHAFDDNAIDRSFKEDRLRAIQTWYEASTGNKLSVVEGNKQIEWADLVEWIKRNEFRIQQIIDSM